MGSVDVDYLIPYVRVKIGDLDSANYRYLDVWLETSLVLSVKNLQRFWRDKYLIDTNNMVTRNPSYNYYIFDESTGIIEAPDEYIIVLMTSLIILGGSLENSAWDAVSWRDNELSFSNLEGSRTRNSMLDRMLTELNSLITSPMKRLAQSLRGPLPGYLNNMWESRKDE